MDRRIRVGLLTVLATAALGAPVRGQAARPAADTLPPGLTADLVTRGRAVFRGPGLCQACHGPEARGGIGPDLTDSLWLHSRGTFEEILATIRAGVPGPRSKSGAMMPPRGGAALSDTDLRAVAAYVWSLGGVSPP